METFKYKVNVTDKIILGGDRMVFFAGPCAAEHIVTLSFVEGLRSGI